MKIVRKYGENNPQIISSLCLHLSLPFIQFATNEAIQRTEAYEYAQSLGSQPCSLPNFQVTSISVIFKLSKKQKSTPKNLS